MKLLRVANSQMTTQSWGTERHLTLEDARAAISASFPEVDVGSLQSLGSGWDFDVYVSADNWVFRFPRRKECIGLFGLERRVHRLVSEVLPQHVAVPTVEFTGQPTSGFPYPFVAHRFIQGIPADAVEPNLLPVVGRGIGAALGAIHSIPETAARRAGVKELAVDDKGRIEWFERRQAAASALRGIDPVIDGAVAWTEQLSVPFPPFQGPYRFIHHDLSPEHIIVDPKTGELTGILDWMDPILGDAARDFVTLVTWGGWGFAEEVLGSYNVPTDAAFRERLHFMARLLSVMWLAEAHELGSDVQRHIGWVHHAFAAADATLPKEGGSGSM